MKAREKMPKTKTFIPPDYVAQRADLGLDLRKLFKRGGTAVGVARARDLKNRRPLTLRTLKRMKAYFDRHEVDLKAPAAQPGHKKYPSAGLIAWLLWGGDEGRKWAEREIRKAEK